LSGLAGRQRAAEEKRVVQFKLRASGAGKEMSQGLMAMLFSAPAVLIIAATILVPFGYAVFLSLHNWNLKRPKANRFIGLENYTDWLTDNDFWEPLRTTFTFAILAVALIVIIALLVALLLNEEFPGRGALRALLLIPWAIPPVVNALLWKWLLDPELWPGQCRLSRAGPHRHLSSLARRNAQRDDLDRDCLFLDSYPAGDVAALIGFADHPQRYL